MKVIAVDPGYERCGVAVVERQGRGETLLFSDCIQTSKEEPFEKRLFAVAEEFKRLIGTWQPDAFATERLYFNTNQKTAMAVAEVRGALLYIAEREGLATAEYTPAQIKTAVTSWGKASKQQVMDMIPKLVVIEKEIRLDDEYDAIATALTYLAHTPQNR